MTKSIWTGMLAVTVGLAGAGSAAQTSTTPQQPTPQTTTAGSDNKVTVTGCLRSAAEATSADATGTAGTTGTTGTTGTAGATGTSGSAEAADAKYILADASLKPADTSGASTAPDTPAPTSPSTPSTTTAGSGQTYRLIANPAALTPHVGKKLELTGTLVEDNAAASPNGAAASGAAQGPALRVESGKVIANSCSQ
jgi:hypothetical protein